MDTHRAIGLITIVICAIAVGFHVFSSSRSWNSTTFAILMAGWSLAPYFAAVLVSILNKRPLIGAVASAVALILDANTYFNVRASESSTAALDYLWTPVWNLVLVVPLVTFLVLKFQRPRAQVGGNAP
jgi:hypothetical protein